MSHDGSTERLRALHRSLQGLALGDALGQALVNAPTAAPEFRPSPWPYSDDTEMAIAIAHVLHRHGRIEQDALATLFGQRFLAAPERGYGPVAYWILSRIAVGDPWQAVATVPFNGGGSLGNGGAMRVAPLGVYFADDLERVAVEAERSAAVTHAHPEGQAGAAAVRLGARPDRTCRVRELRSANGGMTLSHTAIEVRRRMDPVEEACHGRCSSVVHRRDADPEAPAFERRGGGATPAHRPAPV